MDYSQLKDEELAILCKENNDAAFSHLTQRYTDTAKIIVSHFGDCPVEKADLIQEAMFAFICAVYSYKNDGECSFGTYAGACMKNRILTLLRNLSCSKRVPAAMLVSLEGNSELPSSPSPEESLIGENSAEYISEIIRKNLTDREYQVFTLLLAGFTYEQTAEKLGTTVKAVDNTIQRARKKLRERLSSYI